MGEQPDIDRLIELMVPMFKELREYPPVIQEWLGASLVKDAEKRKAK